MEVWRSIKLNLHGPFSFHKLFTYFASSCGLTLFYLHSPVWINFVLQSLHLVEHRRNINAEQKSARWTTYHLSSAWRRTCSLGSDSTLRGTLKSEADLRPRCPDSGGKCNRSSRPQVHSDPILSSCLWKVLVERRPTCKTGDALRGAGIWLNSRFVF